MIALVPVVIFLCVAAADVDGRADTAVASKRAVRERAFALVSALPSRPAPLVRGASIAVVSSPLRGAFVRRDFDTVAARLIAFLGAYGRVRALSVDSLVVLLRAPSDTLGGTHYALLPLDIVTVRKERRASVQNVVKLDTAGNFVPSTTARDLSSTTVDMRVRYVVVDLRSKTIPWSARMTATASSDDFLMERQEIVVSGPRTGRDDQSYRCVMYIFDSLKNTLSREFK